MGTQLPPFELGSVHYVWMEDRTSIAHMIAQRGILPKDGVPPIRYNALRECLADLAEDALAHSSSVHMPRIGCGLAGGRWSEIEPFIQKQLVERGIDVFVYDYEGEGDEAVPCDLS